MIRSAISGEKGRREPGDRIRRVRGQNPRGKMDRARCHQQCVATTVSSAIGPVLGQPAHSAPGRSVISKMCAIAWCARAFAPSRARAASAVRSRVGILPSSSRKACIASTAE